jgi:hypothetical protein
MKIVNSLPALDIREGAGSFAEHETGDADSGRQEEEA